MSNINIKIGQKLFTFAGEILFKHIRKIEPLTDKMQAKEIWMFDYIYELAQILCISDNKDEIWEMIDWMNNEQSEKFMEDFKPIMDTLKSNGKKKKK